VSEPERETLTYEDFGRAARELAQQVADDGFELPVVLPPTLDVVDLRGTKVLVADDVADTGKTLELVKDFCAGQVTEVRTAVVYEKPRSVVSCDYAWKRTDARIDFPWSTLPPVQKTG
jgi:hypothetical protein